MQTTNTKTQTGMRQTVPHPGATYGGNNAGSIETSLADAFFGTEQGAGCARTPLRPCRMRNAKSGSDRRASADAGYEGGTDSGEDAGYGSGARALVPGGAGSGDAILHALPEQGSGEEEQLQRVLSGRASEEAAQETAQEGKETGRSSRRKTERGTESEPGTVAEQKSLFYVDKDALRVTTMRAKNAPRNAPKATKTASAPKAASKAACKTAAKTVAKTATRAGAKTATKPQAGTGAAAHPSVQAMGQSIEQSGGQSVGQAGGQVPNALPAPRVFPRRAPKPLVPARRAALESRAASVPESVLEELQNDVREEDLPAGSDTGPEVDGGLEDENVEEIPEFTDFRDREAPPIPRPVVGSNGSLYAIPEAASHFKDMARHNPAPEPVSSDNGPHGFDDGRDALGTTTYGTAGEIAVRQIASLRAQFAPTAEERLFGAQRPEEQVPGEQREEAQSPKSAASRDNAEAWQADAQARVTAVTPDVSSGKVASEKVTPEDGTETASASEPGGSGGQDRKDRKKSLILLLGLVALFLALAAGYYTLSGPEPTPRPTKQAGQQSAQPSVRLSEEAQRELAILESLGLEAGVNEHQAPDLEPADGAKAPHRKTAVPDPAFGTDPAQGQAKPLMPDAAKASLKEASSPQDASNPVDPAGDATLHALRALAMELDTVRTSLSTLDTVLGAMDERTVRVLEGLNTLQSAVQSLQKDLERALLAKEARKARQARSARAEKSAKASRSTSERTVSRAGTQASRGPAGWRVQGLHEDFAILRDASGRDWKVRAGSSIEDLAIVDIDYAKGRVATSKGDLFWRR